jgi:multiple sugar transport system permease protein
MQAASDGRVRKRGSIRNSAAAREAVIGVLFALPWLIRLFVLNVYPILAAFYYSFTSFRITSAPRWIGLANYVELFTLDKLPMQSLYNSLYFSLFSVPLGLLLALFLAVMLNQSVIMRSFFRATFFVPSIVPGVAAAVLWLWILNSRTGLVNAVLVAIGLPRIPWLSSPDWIKPAFILMSLWGVGYSVVIFLAGLQDVPRHLYDAAEVDGAGTWAKFRHITLPMITPSIFFNLVMGVIGSLQIFGPAFVINVGSQGGPKNSALFYVLYLYRQAFGYLNMGYASALAVVLFLVIMAMTALVLRSSPAWVYYETSK